MKASEMREKSPEELATYGEELRDQLIRLSVAKATQRVQNTAKFSRIRKDIARVQTVIRARQIESSKLGPSTNES